METGEFHISPLLKASHSRSGLGANMFSFGFRGNRGFSMVELSMVLAITAVAAAFAVPMLTEATRDLQLVSDAKKHLNHP